MVRRIPSITLPSDRLQCPRILWMTLTLWSAGFLGSCGPVSTPVKLPVHLTPISKIIEHPKVGSSVHVQGKVTQQAPFLESGAYQIQDETGKIWVMRNHPLPTLGSHLTIKGIVQYESIPIGKQDFGEVYLNEKKQLD